MDDSCCVLCGELVPPDDEKALWEYNIIGLCPDCINRIFKVKRPGIKDLLIYKIKWYKLEELLCVFKQYLK